MPTIKDVYCRFGFVAEAAQLLETYLSTLLLEEHANTGLFEDPNPARAKEILKTISKKTLGQLIKESKEKVPSLETLAELLSSALRERNRLSHSFYLEHNLRLRAVDDSGRHIMLDDLERMHNMIIEAFKALILLSGVDLEKMSEDGYQFLNILLPDHLDIK